MLYDRKDEPQPVSIDKPPDPPKWLAKSDPYAIEVWRDVVPLLVAQKTIAEIDWLAVAGLCSSFSLWRRSCELAECVEVATIEWSRLRSTANNALMQVLRFSQRFGLTPADRAGLHVKRDEKDKDKASKSRFFIGNN